MNFTVENDIQAVLFERFILPELIKGLWKGARPSNHAKPWNEALVHVAPALGRDFGISKRSYNLLRMTDQPDTALAMRAAAYYAREEGREAGMSLAIDLDTLLPEALDSVFSHEQLRIEIIALRRLMKRHISGDPSTLEVHADVVAAQQKARREAKASLAIQNAQDQTGRVEQEQASDDAAVEAWRADQTAAPPDFNAQAADDNERARIARQQARTQAVQQRAQTQRMEQKTIMERSKREREQRAKRHHTPPPAPRGDEARAKRQQNTDARHDATVAQARKDAEAADERRTLAIESQRRQEASMDKENTRAQASARSRVLRETPATEAEKIQAMADAAERGTPLERLQAKTKGKPLFT